VTRRTRHRFVIGLSVVIGAASLLGTPGGLAGSGRAEAVQHQVLRTQHKTISAAATNSAVRKSTAKKTKTTTTTAKKSTAKKSTAKKTVAKKSTTTPRASRSTTTVKVAAPTTVAVATTAVATTPATVVTLPPALPAVGDPAQTRPPDTVPGATAPAVTTTTRPGPTTTLPPAAPPAPANAPSRASAATLEPYRGLGVWVDMYDWTVQWSRRPVPPVGPAQIDQMAASGVQTIYIQAAQWSSPADVLEPNLLVPMIDRAHQLGLQVVVWYLPGLQDVNTDLRKTVAIANLDVDGIQIDIEDRVVVREVPERNRRLQLYLSQLRGLLPGRVLSADIVSPILLDAVPDRWTYPGFASRTPQFWWGGPFPYTLVSSTFDLIAIQAYWTDRSSTGGWRDPYQNITESVRRVRAAVGRADYPVHVIGGIPNRATANDLSGMMQAARDAGSFGLSVYDWVTTPPSWWPVMWNARTVADPRFVATPWPAFVPFVQPPPPTTTIPTTTIPSTAPATVATTIPVVGGPAPTLPPG
jgi:hypothetical protein